LFAGIIHIALKETELAARTWRMHSIQDHS